MPWVIGLQLVVIAALVAVVAFGVFDPECAIQSDPQAAAAAAAAACPEITCPVCTTPTTTTTALINATSTSIHIWKILTPPSP